MGRHDDDNTMEVNVKWRGGGKGTKKYSEFLSENVKMAFSVNGRQALFYYSKFSSCMRTNKVDGLKAEKPTMNFQVASRKKKVRELERRNHARESLCV